MIVLLMQASRSSDGLVWLGFQRNDDGHGVVASAGATGCDESESLIGVTTSTHMVVKVAQTNRFCYY